MNNTLSKKERRYLQDIKERDCVVCDAPGPSMAHHIRQHKQYLCIPLCWSCHQSNINGIHGERRIWDILKMDELDALNKHLGNIFNE